MRSILNPTILVSASLPRGVLAALFFASFAWPNESASRDITLDQALLMSAEKDPEVKASLAELEAAGAARRQDRLLLNPEAEGSYKFGADGNRLELAVSEDIGQILLYPLKWGLGGARYREAKLRAAIDLADRQFEVKRSYNEAAALQQAEMLAMAGMESADAAAELAARQRKAGNINALQQDVQIGLQQDAAAEVARIRAEAGLAKLHLASLIGETISPDSLRIADTLASFPPADPTAGELIRMALGQGPDVAAAQAVEAGAWKSFWLARLNRLPLRAGVAWEQEGGKTFIGPTLAIQVPLDLGWNASARAKWEHEAARQRVAAAEAGIRARISASRARMSAARDSERYLRRTVIPHRKVIMEETQLHYNFMLEGVYELIHARKRIFEAQREAISARKEYWTARAELERILGAPVPPGKSLIADPETPPENPPEPAPAAPAPSGHQHHGGH